MSFINELFKSFARTLGRILVYVAIAVLLMFFFTSTSNASSYYFDFPRNHRLCEGPFNDTIACNGVTQSTIVNSANPNSQKGNYIIATYRHDQNINGVTGTSFNEGNYSLNFAGYFTTIEGTDVDKSLIKAKLLYYPNSSNEYAVATCDNSESFIVTKGKMTSGVTLYKYSYSCETIQITGGKTFLGFQVYLDLPVTNLIEYIDYSVITTNLTLIGEGEATNNDIINNQNQNTDKVIGAIGDLNDIINSTDIPGVDNFEYTDPNAGIITSFLTMPFTLLRVMSNTNTCQSVNLGELYGHPLILECVHPEDFLGNTLWTIIDYFIVFVMISNIAQLFIYIYEKIKNLDDFFGEFYTPKHTKEGYTPRHGG